MSVTASSGPAYRRTQPGIVVRTALGIGALALLAGGFFFRPLFFVAALMAVAGWIFHSLTIEVVAGEVRWRFGPGLVRGRVPLLDIVSVRPVRTNVLEGWGIHLSRFGWLYNVSGFDAVALELRDGRRLALGTDEPEALCRALQGNSGPQA